MALLSVAHHCLRREELRSPSQGCRCCSQRLPLPLLVLSCQASPSLLLAQHLRTRGCPHNAWLGLELPLVVWCCEAYMLLHRVQPPLPEQLVTCWLKFVWFWWLKMFTTWQRLIYDLSVCNVKVWSVNIQKSMHCMMLHNCIYKKTLGQWSVVTKHLTLVYPESESQPVQSNPQWVSWETLQTLLLWFQLRRHWIAIDNGDGTKTWYHWQLSGWHHWQMTNNHKNTLKHKKSQESKTMTKVPKVTFVLWSGSKASLNSKSVQVQVELNWILNHFWILNEDKLKGVTAWLNRQTVNTQWHRQIDRLDKTKTK